MKYLVRVKEFHCGCNSTNNDKRSDRPKQIKKPEMEVYKATETIGSSTDRYLKKLTKVYHRFVTVYKIWIHCNIPENTVRPKY